MATPSPRHQQGLTLIELLLAITLGLGVTLAATALLSTIKTSYLAVHDHALIQDTGHYALEVIAQALRQANFVPRDDAALAELDLASITPGISGLDNSRLGTTTVALSNPQSNTANYGSDVLAVRFFGSADHTMHNCAGFNVAAPVAKASAAELDAQRGASIFFVTADSTGVPELRCKYATQSGGWNTAAIARGVEAFHVLYGIADNDGSVTQYLPAQQITQQQWHRIATVQFALLVRGEHFSGDDSQKLYHLFGPAYQNNGDAQVTITARAQLRKPRRIFRMTVRLRNLCA